MLTSNNAFARSKLMFAAIAAAMSLGGSAQSAALAQIAPYRSRGKGLGKGAKVTVRPARSKYTPHTGAKEQERAKRCYMQSTHGVGNPNMRSAPTMCQADQWLTSYPF